MSDNSRSPGWVIEGRDAAHSAGGETSGAGDISGGGGVTVVIVHGFADSRYGALKRVPLIVPFARRVVVFDLPGQGESQAKQGYGGLREPDDVLAVLGQLPPPEIPPEVSTDSPLKDSQRIVLLGSSMGAGVAIAAAAKAEGEFRKAIVGVIAEGPYRLWDEPLHNMFRYKRYPRWPVIPLAGLWLRLTAKGFKDFDRAKHAARLACPLLVLHGSEDDLCPITSARQIAEAAPAGRFVAIEGGGHNDLPDGHEAAYSVAVENFMKSLGARA
ncbi:MAG: alpha/beta hydrolase [Phycisphaerales bacterium]